MSSNWGYDQIGNHAEVYSGFAFKSKDLGNHGIPVVKIKNVNNRVVDVSDTQFFPESLINEKHDKFILQDGDVLIAMTGQGSVGRVGRLSLRTDRPVLLNQRVGKFVTKHSLDLRYFYYVSSSEYYEKIFFNTGIGSGQPNLSPDDIKKVKIPIPPLEHQKSIAHILGTLDDKIELNRRMNETLEGMAQALFKSWFVDFDPVIDKAMAADNPIPELFQKRAAARKQLGNKRKPLPAHIAQHIPDSFVFDVEMGWIPEGWGASTIGEQVSCSGGGTPSTKNAAFWEHGTHAFCTPKEMSNLNSVVLTDTERHLTDAGVNKISSGQLSEGVVLMSSRAPIGYLAISAIPVSVNQGIIALLPKEKYSSMYLMNWVHFNMQAIKDRANGSTFLEISKKNFRPIPFLVSNKQVLGLYNQLSQDTYKKLLLCTNQTQELTRLRDTLLPKLLSGELRVPDAEKLIEKAL